MIFKKDNTHDLTYFMRHDANKVLLVSRKDQRSFHLYLYFKKSNIKINQITIANNKFTFANVASKSM